MAFVSAVTGDDSTKKFMDVLQNDFKTLSLETKKKYPQIREVLTVIINSKKETISPSITNTSTKKSLQLNFFSYICTIHFL